MLKPIKNVKVYEIIMNQIKELIRTGELKTGDKLPSERDLAFKLNVSRTSVREAIKALSTLGFIESRHGEGNYIKNNFEDILLEPLSIVFMLLGNNNDEVLDVRRIIEPEVAALAAKNISEEELRELQKVMDELKESTDTSFCAKLDKEFHCLIAKASKNHLLSIVIFSLSSLIEEYIDESKMYDIDKQKIINEHNEIFIALVNHDSKKAFIEAKNHLI